MKDAEQFDRFYQDARSRVLLLTYCLTGDLPSSRAAVRDAFVVCAHHWRKVSRHDDPEAWLRSRAFAHALRRHTAKLWHREKGLPPEVKATLDALGRLTVTQRKVLLLAQLTPVSLAALAREVGVPQADAERELQTATSQFTLHRDIPTTGIRGALEAVREHVADSRWPRATIVRRAGTTRRRTHTLVGVAAVIAALVVTGSLVTDGRGLRPTLAGERAEASSGSGSAGSVPVGLSADTLLPASDVARFVLGRHWTATATNDGSGGDGLVMPCQQERYADPKGAAALVRRFESRAKAGHAPTAVQASEASRSDRAAGRAFDTAVGWFAGCAGVRAQLVGTTRVDRVGDEAMLLALHTWDAPRSTVVAGVARTGRYTTTTVVRSPGTGAPALRPAARLLAAAVHGLCGLPEAGSCATRPRLTAVPPVPVAEAPALLAEVDLPPVPGVERPWVGTEPRQPRQNLAATGCDHADFSGDAVRNGATRTFLVPHAHLPVEFGLTETAGELSAAKAAAFVDDIRDRLGTCHDRQMGTDVTRLHQLAQRDRDLSAWRVSTEISDKRTVSFLMAIVRDRGWVAQVGFVPDGRHTMSTAAFLDLADRALARLAAMGPPTRP